MSECTVYACGVLTATQELEDRMREAKEKQHRWEKLNTQSTRISLLKLTFGAWKAFARMKREVAVKAYAML